MAIIDEFITILGFEADTSGGEKFEKALGGIKKGAIAVAAAVTAAAGAVLLYTDAVAGAGDETGKFSSSIGVTPERLQEFEFAAERAGGSAASLRGDMLSMTQSMESAIPGEINQGLFLLGIDAKNAADEIKSADEVLLEISDRFSTFDAKQKQVLSTQVGLSQGTLRFVAQGREEIERLSTLAKEFGGITSKEDTEKAAEYADRMTDIKFIFSGIGKAVAFGLLPNINKALTSFESFLVANKELVSLKLTEVITGIGRGFNFLWSTAKGIADLFTDEMSPSMLDFVKNLDFAKITAKALVGAVAIIAVAFAPVLIKIALVTAAVTFLFLIIDDLIVMMTGGKSVIGEFFEDLFKKFPILEKGFEFSKKLVADLLDNFKLLFASIVSLAGKAFTFLSDKFKELGIGDDIIKLYIIGFKQVGTVLRFIVDMIGVVAKALSGDLSGAVSGAVSAFSDLFGDTFENLVSMATEVNKVGLMLDNAFDPKAAVAALNTIGIKIGEIAKNAVESVGESIGNAVNTAVDYYASAFSKKFDDLKNSAGEKAGEIIASLNPKNLLPDFAIDLIGGTSEVQSEKITGPGNTSNPANDYSNVIDAGRMISKAFEGINIPQNITKIFGGTEDRRSTTQAFAGQVSTTNNNTNKTSTISPTINQSFVISGAQNPQLVASAISSRSQSGLSTAFQTLSTQPIE